MVEVAINVCFALLHEMAPPANKKTYLDVNFLESRQPKSQNLNIQPHPKN